MKPEQEVLRKQVEEIQEVADTLDLEEGNSDVSDKIERPFILIGRS